MGVILKPVNGSGLNNNIDISSIVYEIEYGNLYISRSYGTIIL